MIWEAMKSSEWLDIIYFLKISLSLLRIDFMGSLSRSKTTAGTVAIIHMKFNDKLYFSGNRRFGEK